MCGICGIFDFTGQSDITYARLRAIADTMVHRGPDDEGTYLSPYHHVGFGFRRLSIVDLAGGHQPMSDQEQSIWIVFNGEIYNFPELRNELETYGHGFRTKSDTEVIIHGYKQWGTEVLNHLK